MKLVVDANILIAALIKDGISREIIISGQFILICPEFMSEELRKHSGLIAKKAGISVNNLNVLTTLLLSKIQTIPKDEYQTELEQAKKLVEKDLSDVPYAACCLAKKCDGVWTNDADFNSKRNLKVLRTQDIIKLI